MQSCLFGDGAVALVLGLRPQRVRFGDVVHLTNIDATDANLLTMKEGGSAHPFRPGTNQDYVMDTAVPATGARYAMKAVARLMQSSNMTSADMADMNYVFIHTGSKKILDAVVAAIGCGDGNSPSASHDILLRYGNLSSASIGFMLAEHATIPGAGVAVSFGVGFSASAGAFYIEGPRYSS